MVDSIYSEIILDLYKNPKNFGKLTNYDLKASGGNYICGDTVTFELKIEKEKITDVKFTGEGCAISRASESLLTEMVKGKTISEVKKISSDQVFENLGGVIQTRIKCALLGYEVLKIGIEKYSEQGGKKTEVAGINI